MEKPYKIRQNEHGRWTVKILDMYGERYHICEPQPTLESALRLIQFREDTLGHLKEDIYHAEACS